MIGYQIFKAVIKHVDPKRPGTPSAFGYKGTKKSTMRNAHCAFIVILMLSIFFVDFGCCGFETWHTLAGARTYVGGIGNVECLAVVLIIVA